MDKTPKLFFYTGLNCPVLIFVLFPHCHQEKNRDQKRHPFRHDDRDPDPVNPPDQGQEQDSRNLKHQRTQKGDQCGNEAVVEGSKKGGTENTDPGK